jgi:uncharacterized protein (TIGR02246 family)
MIYYRFLIVTSMLCCWSVQVQAAEFDAQALQAAVRKSADKYIEAFASRDAKAMAAMFTPEAEYIDDTGTIFHGRDLIEAEFAAHLASNPEGELQLEILSIRPVAQTVIVEDGVSLFQPKDKGPNVQTRYTVTHVKQADGTWLMASVRELESTAFSPHDELLKLSWLEGAWREENGNTTTTTEWKWSEDGNFLISEFSTHRRDGRVLSGTQRIGYDAERKQFHSWVFESTGGAADGWWSESHDGVWSVQLNGIESSGARFSCVMSYFRDGADGLVITQDQCTRGSTTYPSLTHRVVRKPPEPATAQINKATK